MSKFVIKNIESVKGTQTFKQLVIVGDKVNVNKLQLEIEDREKNNEEVIQTGILDEYENSLQKSYQKSFLGIISIMNRVANLQPVADTKFKDVTPKGELIKEFEFKYQDLRVLAIKIQNGKLVMLCGYKNQQDKNFSRFRSLKKQYLEFTKQTK